jgi:hypothetical protein
MNLRSWFFGPKESEYERGKRNAIEFLTANPTQTEIDSYWNSACESEHFDDSKYDKGAKEIIRPRWEKGK